jgi:hypothetical protein
MTGTGDKDDRAGKVDMVSARNDSAVADLLLSPPTNRCAAVLDTLILLLFLAPLEWTE